jgi:hypothetical protein
MKRMLLIGALTLPILACTAPGDRAALPPLLPDKVTPLPYSQLHQRALALVSRANDAFYLNNWGDLEEAARGLEQTAQYLARAEDVPAKHKDTLATLSADLGKLSKSLREAATVRDVKKTEELMSQLHRKVRAMRLGD